MSKILVFTGSRDFALYDGDEHRDEANTIYNLLKSAAVALVGDCPTGLDAVVRDSFYGDDLAEIEVFVADWAKWGRPAGPLRNKAMIEQAVEWGKETGWPVEVHAWPRGRSTGTRNCMRWARKAGLRVIEHKQETRPELLYGYGYRSGKTLEDVQNGVWVQDRKAYLEKYPDGNWDDVRHGRIEVQDDGPPSIIADVVARADEMHRCGFLSSHDRKEYIRTGLGYPEIELDDDE